MANNYTEQEWNTIRAKLNEAIAESGIMLKDIAHNSGVSLTTLKSFRYGCSTIRVDSLERILTTIGYEIKLVKKE